MKKLSVFADFDEIYAFAAATGISSTDIRKAQVYYLYHEAGYQRKDIATITKYAPSTLSTMRNKVLEYKMVAEKIFIEFDSAGEIAAKNSSKILVARESAVKYRKCGELSIPMVYLPDCGEDLEGQRTAYFFKFYGTDREAPIFCKIGTTIKSVDERLRREIGDYRKAGLDIRAVEICKIYDCGSLPPEAFESYLRAMLIARYPNSYVRNDRFFGVDIDTDLFIQLCAEFAMTL